MPKSPEEDAHCLIPPLAREKLLENGRRGREVAHLSTRESGYNPLPVVKLFTPDAGATWLLSEMDPDDEDIVYGVCDLSMGCVEFGPVSLTEIASLRGGLRLPVERDLHFRPKAGIWEYLRVGSDAGRIIEPIQHAAS